MVFVCLLISSSSLAVTAGFPLLAGGWWPVVGQRCTTCPIAVLFQREDGLSSRLLAALGRQLSTVRRGVKPSLHDGL